MRRDPSQDLQTACGQRYAIGPRLGHGAQGEVHRATDRLSGRSVAIKRWSGDASSLAQEYGVLARLSHPCLVEVLDFDQDEAGRPTLVMAYLPGAGDGARLRGLDADGWYRLCWDLLRAVQYLHDRGIVHADIKPENIDFAPAPQPARLLDFGLAGKESAGGEARGTLAYVAPELLQGQPPSRRSDLYSVGAVLFEAATGRPPFEGDADAVVRQKLQSVPPSPAEHCAQLPPAVLDVVQSLLQPVASARPASAAQTAEAIARAASLPADFGLDLQPGRQRGRAPLCGRDGELAEIERTLGWGEAPAQSRCVFLSGEAGVGKSRLLAELAVRARLAGARVIPLDAEGSKAPLAAAATLLSPESSPSGGEGSQLRWLQTLASRAAELARARPLFITLDGAEQAGEGVHELLRLLALEADGAPITVVAAGRDATASPRGFRPHTLAALNARECAALVAATLGQVEDLERFADRIHARCGGLPALVEAELAALSARGVLKHFGGRWQVDFDALERCETSRDARMAATARLETLSAAERALLQWVALLAPRAPLETLRALDEGLDPTAVTTLVSEGLLQAEHDGALRCDRTVAEAALALLPEEEARAWHLSALRVLEERHAGDETSEASAPALLRHAEAAGRADSALRYARQAAESARRSHDHAAAAAYLERALKQLPAEGSDALAASLLEALGDCLHQCGDSVGAAANYGRAALISPERSGQLRHARARALAAGGAHAEALALYESLVEHPEEPGWQPSAASFDHGWTLMMLGRYPEARRLCQAALATPEAQQTPKLGCALRRLEGTIAWHAGDYEHSVTVLQEAAAAARRDGLADELPEILLNLGTALRYRGELDASAQACQDAAESYRAQGLLSGETRALNNAGIANYLKGHWSEAQQLWEQFLQGVQRLGNANQEVDALNNIGTLCRDRGQLAQAQRYFEEGVALAERIGYGRVEAMLHGNLAETLTLAGELEAAQAELSLCIEQSTRMDAQSELIEAERRRAELHLAQGEAAATVKQCRALLEAQHDGQLGIERANILRVLGQAQQQLGALESARQSLVEACGIAQEQGARFELALVRGALAAVESERGDYKRCFELLDPAIETLEQLGALGALERARETLIAARSAARESGAGSGRLWRALELSRRMSAERNVSALLREAIAAALDITGFERGFAVLYDAEGTPQLQVSQNLDPLALQGAEEGPSQSIAERVFRSGVPVGSTSLQEDERFCAQESIVSLGLRGVRCVPMQGREARIGVIYVDTRGLGNDTVQDDLQILEALATQAAICVENVELTERERRKGELLAHAAHEINNPLAGLVGYAELLLDEADRFEPEDREGLEAIASQAHRLRRLTRSMLSLARLDAGALRLEPRATDLEETLSLALRELRPVCESQGIRGLVQAVDGLPGCLGDRDRLVQLFTNLVQNAIKYSPAGGAITLHAELVPGRPALTRREGAHHEQLLGSWAALSDPARLVRVYVDDDGPGVPADERERIFDAFTQVKGRKSAAGSGLGLAICKAIVEAHQGRIWVEESPSGGARFCVELLVARSAAQSAVA